MNKSTRTTQELKDFFSRLLGYLPFIPLEILPSSPELFRTYRHLLRKRDVRRRPGGWVYKGKFYPDYLTVGGASFAIFHKALQYCVGYGVDIGAGYWPLPGSIPVDIKRGKGKKRSIDDFAIDSLDFVFSSHCLEHIEQWEAALHSWIRRLKFNGILFLYLPHPDCLIWEPGSPFVGNEHKWVPTPQAIKGFVTKLGCHIISYDDGPDSMQSFFICARKRGNVEA